MFGTVKNERMKAVCRERWRRRAAAWEWDMEKRKKYTGVCFACALALLLGGCSVRNVTRGMEEGEHYDAVISVKGNGGADTAGNADGSAASAEADSGREDGADEGAASAEAGAQRLYEQLRELSLLVGRTDEEAGQMLGGGEENRTADGTVLVGRNYQAALFDRTCSIYTSYDEAGMVSLVVAQLPGQNAEEYERQLEALFGEGRVLEDESMGEKSQQWDDSGYRYTLNESEDAVSLDVGWAYGE